MDDARENYLSAGHTVKSWLLTTDHKRIGLLYLFSIIVFFFIAAVAAAMMRLQLLTPNGDLLFPDTYNKMFTIHGVLMVWFFLIPSIRIYPAIAGCWLTSSPTRHGTIFRRYVFEDEDEDDSETGKMLILFPVHEQLQRFQNRA